MTQRLRALEASSASTEEEVDDDQGQNQADGASAVVLNSWAPM